MRILILSILLIPSAFAYDPSRLAADLDLIQNEFLTPKKARSKKKKEISRAPAIPKNSKIIINDLEEEYFDSVSTKASTGKRLRSRK